MVKSTTSKINQRADGIHSWQATEKNTFIQKYMYTKKRHTNDRQSELK